MGLEVYFKFVLNVALIVLLAFIAGLIFERYFKQPRVLGELLIGVVISPFALGGLLFQGDPIILNFAIIKEAFGAGEFSVMEVLSMIAVITLLFQAGTETEIKEFLRSGLSGALVAVMGVVLPFFMAYFTLLLLGYEEHLAVFMGAVLTATSISISVRVLMDLGWLRTKAGTTILVAAVIDDILGILVLSVVVAIATTGTVDIMGLVTLIGVGLTVWFAIVLIGARFNEYVSKYILRPLRDDREKAVLALAIGFALSYVMTLVGLHPVIGAYAAGLLFAATAEGHKINEAVRPISMFLAPLFFTFLGMQVNVIAVLPVIGLTMLLFAIAVIGKLLGCFIPARFVSKLSNKESMIVGVGMTPRGEVGLVIAGAGFATGVIPRDLFGSAVFLSIFTTLIVPPLLKWLINR